MRSQSSQGPSQRSASGQTSNTNAQAKGNAFANAVAKAHNKLYTIMTIRYKRAQYVCQIHRQTLNERYRVQIGGWKNAVCMSVFVYDNDNDAYASGIQYDPKCAQATPLSVAHFRKPNGTVTNASQSNTNASVDSAQSEPTPLSLNTVGVDGVLAENGAEPDMDTVSFVRAGFSIIFRLFPKLESISFKDDSKIASRVRKGIEVPLYTYYIAKHGTTWYSAQFGARPHSDAYASELRRNIDEMLTETIDERDYDSFAERHIRPTVGRQTVAICKHLRPHYKRGTMGNFMRKITREYDCVVCKSWLASYVSSRTRWEPEADWKVDREEMLKWPEKNALLIGQPLHERDPYFATGRQTIDLMALSLEDAGSLAQTHRDPLRGGLGCRHGMDKYTSRKEESREKRTTRRISRLHLK